tara:strand:- start:130 stop:333 length:204 start_codon:yes stop_codon:yes gene_type:complete
VVEALLVPPVMVSDAANVPEGTFNVIVVLVGNVRTEAVALLVPPVIVSPTEKLEELETVIVIGARGY